jgi:ATP-dependent Lon protease
MELFNRIEEPTHLADIVANSLVSEAMQRQRLLEQPNPLERLRELIRFLGEQFPGGQRA